MSYSYELEQSGRNIYHCLFSALIWSRGSNIYYSNYCIGCNDLFGCEGLRNKSYCIFNKQYTKEEYDIHVAKIIAHMQTTGEWGEFFDPSLSPFGYNETVAMEYFPVSYDVGTKYFSSSDDTNRMNNNSSLHQWGYHRSDYTSDPVIPAGITTLTGDQVPSDISSVTDDICKQIIICEVSGRPFMIQKAELVFYRKHSIPLPRRHPDIRHEDRMKLRPGRTLHLRCCDKCGDEMLSVYPETVASSSLDKGRSGGGICEQNSQVYCEKCYQHEVYA